MALFANTTAADLQKGDIIMFAMGSSSPGRVAPRADQCLGGQFACAPMSIMGCFRPSSMSQIVVVGGILATRYHKYARVGVKVV